MKPYLPALLCCVVCAGCVTTGSVLSTDDEIQLGMQIAKEIEKQEKLLDSPQVQAYVREIGERLAQVSDRQDVPYTFKVIDAKDTVNAFALPGGFMYVYTGLMRICRNEAELASVMAHEIGHVAGHHHGEALAREMQMSYLARLLLGEDPGRGAQLIADLVGTGFSMRYSREDEREADALGMTYLYRAGYSPDAMITFMHRMLAEERGGAPPLWFSSHPATEERIHLLNALVQQVPREARATYPLYTDRYEERALRPIR